MNHCRDLSTGGQRVRAKTAIGVAVDETVGAAKRNGTGGVFGDLAGIVEGCGRAGAGKGHLVFCRVVFDVPRHKRGHLLAADRLIRCKPVAADTAKDDGTRGIIIQMVRTMDKSLRPFVFMFSLV